MKNRFATRVALATLALALAVSASTPVWGQNPPKITFNVKFAPPKSPVLVSGKNFTPNASVVIELDQVPVGQAHTNARGNFSRSEAFIPSGTTEGQHVITVIDSSGITVQVGFLIETDWPQQRFDPGNTGYNPYEWKLDTTTVQALAPVWNTVGRPGICFGMFLNLTGSAIVAGRVVYYSTTTGLLALDPATGNPLWGFGTSSSACKSPTANGSGHRVFFQDASGEVWSVNTITHKKVWSHPLSGGTGYGWAVAVGNALFTGDDAGKLTSLNQSNGGVNWTTTNASNTALAWNNGVLFTDLDDNNSGIGSLSAYDAKTGKHLWQVNPNDDYCYTSNSVISQGASVYKRCGRGFEARDSSTGMTLLWAADTWVTNPALANGVIYTAFSSSGPSAIGALKAADGSNLWGDILSPSLDVSDAIVANGVVYMGLQTGTCSGTRANYVLALDANSGNVLWSYPLPTPTVLCAQAPVPAALVDGTLYVVNTADGGTGDLWAFRQP